MSVKRPAGNADRGGRGSVTTRPSGQVIEAVAERENVDPTDLPPLYDVLDPDALDRWCQSTTGALSFEWVGYRIFVDVDERVLVTVGRAPDGLEE